jgi:hypothetical protein
VSATSGHHRQRRARARRAAPVIAATVLVGAIAVLTGVDATSTASSTAASASTGHQPGHPAGPDPTRPAASPPPDLVALAPGTEVPAGLDQSDPFLTVADGRYVLITSGGTGADAAHVPLATSTDFVHWSAPVDALPVLPPWAHPGYTWAPDLHRFGATWALYFTAMLAGRTPQTECIGSAVAPSPGGPFTASPTPFICQLDKGGSIDPRVFVDRVGTPWMQWKSDQNIGGATTPTVMWSQQLSPDGTRLLATPSPLLAPDRPWQGTIVEAPDMILAGGAYWVVYSANWYNSADYAIGAARCAGPAGPCADTGPAPLLASNFQGLGPGEASVFSDHAGVWMLYSPRRSAAPEPDVPPRPVYITRLAFTPQGPVVIGGRLPGAIDLLSVPPWSPTA